METPASVKRLQEPAPVTVHAPGETVRAQVVVQGSAPAQVDAFDLKRIAVLAGISAVAAGLTWFSEWISKTDFGDWTPVVMLVYAVVVEGLKKFLTDSRVAVVKSLVVLFALLTLAGSSYAADIDAPKRVDPHNLVTCMTRGPGSAIYSSVWIVMGPRGFEKIYTADNTCVFTGPAGTYMVTVVVLKATTPPVLDQGQAIVVIGDAPPTPPTPPGPNPPGPVPIPDGAFGLTKLAVEWGAAVPAAARGRAAAFASNFETVASQISAGGFADLKAANDSLKAKNTATAGVDREAWLPWFTSFAGKMTSLYSSGACTTLPQHADAYRAVSEGLKLVR